ncbi:MAG: hypothetical protein J7K68_00010 [Candidatus Diapherotrites archaeon]|nr:hypothetical protein [Candidatus Diapherotrites archaeon]
MPRGRKKGTKVSERYNPKRFYPQEHLKKLEPFGGYFEKGDKIEILKRIHELRAKGEFPEYPKPLQEIVYKVIREGEKPPYGFFAHPENNAMLVREMILKVAEEEGVTPEDVVKKINCDHFGLHGIISAYMHFGSLHNAVAAAGFEPIKKKEAYIEPKRLEKVINALEEMIKNRKHEEISWSNALSNLSEKHDMSFKTLQALLNPSYDRFGAGEESLKKRILEIRRQWGLDFEPIIEELIGLREKVYEEEKRHPTLDEIYSVSPKASKKQIENAVRKLESEGFKVHSYTALAVRKLRKYLMEHKSVDMDTIMEHIKLPEARLIVAKKMLEKNGEIEIRDGKIISKEEKIREKHLSDLLQFYHEFHNKDIYTTYEIANFLGIEHDEARRVAERLGIKLTAPTYEEVYEITPEFTHDLLGWLIEHFKENKTVKTTTLYEVFKDVKGEKVKKHVGNALYKLKKRGLINNAKVGEWTPSGLLKEVLKKEGIEVYEPYIREGYEKVYEVAPGFTHDLLGWLIEHFRENKTVSASTLQKVFKDIAGENTKGYVENRTQWLKKKGLVKSIKKDVWIPDGLLKEALKKEGVEVYEPYIREGYEKVYEVAPQSTHDLLGWLIEHFRENKTVSASTLHDVFKEIINKDAVGEIGNRLQELKKRGLIKNIKVGVWAPDGLLKEVLKKEGIEVYEPKGYDKVYEVAPNFTHDVLSWLIKQFGRNKVVETSILYKIFRDVAGENSIGYVGGALHELKKKGLIKKVRKGAWIPDGLLKEVLEKEGIEVYEPKGYDKVYNTTPPSTHDVLGWLIEHFKENKTVKTTTLYEVFKDVKGEKVKKHVRDALYELKKRGLINNVKVGEWTPSGLLKEALEEERERIAEIKPPDRKLIKKCLEHFQFLLDERGYLGEEPPWKELAEHVGRTPDEIKSWFNAEYMNKKEYTKYQKLLERNKNEKIVEKMLKRPPYSFIIRGMLGELKNHRGIAEVVDEFVTGHRIDTERLGLDALADRLRKELGFGPYGRIKMLLDAGRIKEARELLRRYSKTVEDEELKKDVSEVIEKLQIFDRKLAELIIKFRYKRLRKFIGEEQTKDKAKRIYRILLKRLLSAGLEPEDAESIASALMRDRLPTYLVVPGEEDIRKIKDEIEEAMKTIQKDEEDIIVHKTTELESLKKTQKHEGKRAEEGSDKVAKPLKKREKEEHEPTELEALWDEKRKEVYNTTSRFAYDLLDWLIEHFKENETISTSTLHEVFRDVAGENVERYVANRLHELKGRGLIRRVGTGEWAPDGLLKEVLEKETEKHPETFEKVVEEAKELVGKKEYLSVWDRMDILVEAFKALARDKGLFRTYNQLRMEMTATRFAVAVLFGPEAADRMFKTRKGRMREWLNELESKGISEFFIVENLGKEVIPEYYMILTERKEKTIKEFMKMIINRNTLDF